MQAFHNQMQFLWPNTFQIASANLSEIDLHVSSYCADEHKCSPVSQLLPEELPDSLAPSPTIADWPHSLSSSVVKLARANSAKQVGSTSFNWQDFLGSQTTLEGAQNIGSNIDSWRSFVFRTEIVTPANAALSLLALATSVQTPQTSMILHYIVSKLCSHFYYFLCL